MSTLHRTIVRPIVTEQSSAAYQERGEYTFRVMLHGTPVGDLFGSVFSRNEQLEISLNGQRAALNAIEKLFGVKVTGVWTSNQRGKSRRVGQQVGRRPHWKKAVVKLRAGDTIDIFEG